MKSHWPADAGDFWFLWDFTHDASGQKMPSLKGGHSFFAHTSFEPSVGQIKKQPLKAGRTAHTSKSLIPPTSCDWGGRPRGPWGEQQQQIGNGSVSSTVPESTTWTLCQPHSFDLKTLSLSTSGTSAALKQVNWFIIKETVLRVFYSHTGGCWDFNPQLSSDQNKKGQQSQVGTATQRLIGSIGEGLHMEYCSHFPLVSAIYLHRLSVAVWRLRCCQSWSTVCIRKQESGHSAEGWMHTAVLGGWVTRQTDVQTDTKTQSNKQPINSSTHTPFSPFKTPFL
jgi:hypothetical protein